MGWIIATIALAAILAAVSIQNLIDHVKKKRTKRAWNQSRKR